jgi:hypothetical protein
MSDVVPIKPTITAGGLAEARRASEGGFKVSLTHVGIGDGNGAGYAVSRDQTALRRERVRAPIGGGEIIGPSAVSLTTIIPPGESFAIREVGFYTGPVLFAVWSDSVELADRPSIASLVLALNLYLLGVPADAVTVSTSGMSLNIAVAGPLTDFSLAITQLQGRALAQDVESFTKIIRGTFR